MGDYVGFAIKAKLKEDTPIEVIDILEYVSMNIPDMPTPTSPLAVATLKRIGNHMLCMQSAYQQEYEDAQPEQGKRVYYEDDHWHLHTSSGPKWGHGIQEFLLFIKEYIDPSEYGKEIANSQSEYTPNKTFYTFQAHEITWRDETTHKEYEF